MLTDIPIKPEFMIDTRPPEIFAKSHIKDSINIPFGKNFCNWVNFVLPENISVGVVADSQSQIDLAIYNLQQMGHDRIAMQFIWDDNRASKEFIVDCLPLMDVFTLQHRIQNAPNKLYILDVRTDSEWAAGHIKEAHHIELPFIRSNIDSFPKDSTLAVTCESGYRASIVASLLKKRGYQDVTNIQGGMAAWKKAKFSTIG